MKLEKIREILNEWYFENKRTLPWREISDPYLIWISEIILQQTRVNQGIDYYNRFIKRFPDINSLASASEDEVLTYWQGLGYYSRARNLHKSSKKITEIYAGEFPENYDDIVKLPGIGSYTASAICSFAFHKNYAVLDGNVFRVLSRLFNISTPIDTGAGKKEFTKLAENLLDKEDSYTHNQAIMEFGALQCTPLNPRCDICPLSNYCNAYRQNCVMDLPVKRVKVAVSYRYFNYFYIQNGDYFYLQKRNNKDIWQNLYEFPLIETTENLPLPDLVNTVEFKHLMIDMKDIEFVQPNFTTKHILSHRIILASFYSIKISGENNTLKSLIKIKFSDIENYAIPRLIEVFLEKRILI